MIVGTIAVVLLLAAFVVGGLFLYNYFRQDRERGDGKQVAGATSEDAAQRGERPAVASPMPDSKYSSPPGEWGLLNPQPVELDRLLRELCASFAQKPASERAEFRAAVSTDESYTLLYFARRSAVFALRDRDPGILEDGLTAVAIVESERTDFRDILVALAILYHVAARIGVDPDAALARAAALAEPDTSKLISSFAARDPADQHLRGAFQYHEVSTASGIGLVQWGLKDYDPKADLVNIATKVATVVEQDNSYLIYSIEAATELPPVWFGAGDNPQLASLMDMISGAVTISGLLDKTKHPDPHTQQFTVFLVELDTPESVQALLKIADDAKPTRHAMLGFASDKVFALLMARSKVMGTDPYESVESLERFREPIGRVLDEATR